MTHQPHSYAVEILAQSTDGAWRRGSGYVVAPGRILTALHVIIGEGPFKDRGLVQEPQRIVIRTQGDFLARFPEAAQASSEQASREIRMKANEDFLWRSAELLWPAPEARIPDLDLAVLKIDATDLPHVSQAPIVQCLYPNGDVECRGTGFPRWANALGGDGEHLANPRAVTATLTDPVGRYGAAYPIHVKNGSPERQDEWKSFSGTAFFDDLYGRLVGVACQADPTSGNSGLRLTLMADASDRQDFSDFWVAAKLRKPTKPGPEFFASNRLTTFGIANTAPAEFRANAELFILTYLGTSEKAVPFGGREPILALLDHWVEDPTEPHRCLLFAPGGRGKSALLVHWLEKLPDRFLLIFLPISVRFGTNRPELFYHALAARLADLFSVELTPSARNPVEDYKGIAINLLRGVGKLDRPIVLVVDGLDEAAGWKIETSLFYEANPQLRILISARLLSGDGGASGWLGRLLWDRLGPTPMTVEVPALDSGGIAAVLRSVGGVPADFAQDPQIVAELARLTGGDPLLVRLYADDLQQQGGESGRLRMEDLAKCKPGFGAFFEEWLEDQTKIWNANEQQIPQDTVDVVLLVLACAFGPLAQADLSTLCKRLSDSMFSLQKKFIDALQRFVIGDGVRQGYALTHPKLAEYLLEGYFIDPERVEAAKRVFIDWGLETMSRLNANNLETHKVPPQKCPPYLLLYLTQHLLAARAVAADFMQLTQKGWLQAWKSFEGGYSGFSRDVTEAYKIATGPTVEARSGLALQLRCQLIKASIFSLVNGPPLLLSLCEQFGVLTRTEALFRAGTLADESERAEALARLAVQGPSGSGEVIIGQALEIVRSINEHWNRSRALLRVLRAVPDLSASLVTTALDLALQLSSKARARGPALEALAPRLSQTHLERAQIGAEEIANPNERDRARLSIYLRQFELSDLAPDDQFDFMTELLDEIVRLEYDFDRIRMLKLLCPHVPKTLVIKIIKIAQTDTKYVDYASVLSALLEYKKEVPIELLERVVGTKDVADWEYIEMLSSLMPYLPPDLQHWVTKRFLPEHGQYQHTWMSVHPRTAQKIAILAPFVPQGERRSSFVAEGLRILGIDRGDIDARCRALVTLAPGLPEHLLEHALSCCSQLPIRKHGAGTNNVEVRAYALEAFVQKFKSSQRELLKSALTASLEEVEVIGDGHVRAKALAALVPFLPLPVSDDCVRRILTAGDVPESVARFELVAALARRLPPTERDRLLDLDQALAEAKTLTHEFSKNEAVTALIPELPKNLIEKAHAIASEIATKVDARALAAIAPYVEGSDRRIAVQTALSAAQAANLELSDICSQTLCTIVPWLQPDQVIIAAELAHALGTAHFEAILQRTRQAAAGTDAEGGTGLLAALLSQYSEDNGSQPDEPSPASERIDGNRRPIVTLQSTMETWSRQSRSRALSDISEHAKAMVKIGDAQLIAEAVRAICDTASWWP